MNVTEKAWPVVVRHQGERVEVLAFTHPDAGKQFVKGTIQAGETPGQAAVRELGEESGLRALGPWASIGSLFSVEHKQNWHFFLCRAKGLPDTWSHRTEDDFGHTYSFFWHPLDEPLDRKWHVMFHRAFAFFAPHCIAE